MPKEIKYPIIYPCLKCGEELEITAETQYPFQCPACGYHYQAGCYRCKIPLPDADRRTAVYCVAPDMVVPALKSVQVALYDGRAEEDKWKTVIDPEGHEKQRYIAPETLPDDALEGVVLGSEEYEIIADKHGKRRIRKYPAGTVRVIHREITVQRQLTGVVCRECLNEETDQPIWGSANEIDANDARVVARATADAILAQAKIDMTAAETPEQKREIWRVARLEAQSVIDEGERLAQQILAGEIVSPLR